MKTTFRFACAIWLAGNQFAVAQSLFGTILGTVTDSSQAAIPGARLTIRNKATNAERVLTTDSLGDYEAPTLPVGTYEVSCEAKGFKRALSTSIVLEVDQRERLDMRLELGDVAQTVEIAGAAALIDTDAATQGAVVDNRNVLTLPLNGRNFQQLALLAPGVSAPVAGGGVYFSIGGARSLGTSFLLDGTTNSNTNANVTFINPSIDVIQEFQVLRNTFNAEFGHGAGQVNVVTRSGSNDLHFTLLEFLRNDKIQARNFFDKQKPAYRQNQFGGTVSGPILIPKLYNGRNKLFFLVNYEGFRERTPSTLLATVPTQAQLNGDLSSLGKPVVDPSNNAPFPGAQIPSSRLDPSSRNFEKFMPVTTAPIGAVGSGLNYVTAGSGLTNWDQVTLRIDYNFSASSSAFARYSLTDNTTTPLTLLPSYGQSTLSRQQSAVLGHNYIITPNLINEFRFGFARHNAHILPNAALLPQASQQKYGDAIGIQNLLSESLASANSPPAVTLTGYTGVGGAALITQRVNTFSYVDNLTWIHGKHSFKFGADIRRELIDTRNIGATQGSFNFTGAFSGAPLGDFLLGIPQTASGTAPPGADGVNLGTLWQTFAQDDWKVSRSLTLSFGVRWEYQTPWVNNRDRISRFDPTFPGGRLIYPGTADYFVPGLGFIPTSQPLASPGLYAPDHTNFDPRFGFAWRPFGNNTTSVRGGYGLFVDNTNENSNAVFSIGNVPDVVSYSITNDLKALPLVPWSQMFPAPNIGALARGITSVQTVMPTMPNPYVQQWSLNVERELARNLALEIGYMGSKGTALDLRRYINQAVPDLPGQTTSIVSREPYPAFAPTMVANTRTGFSTYEAFIARLQQRYSNGFSFLVAYTYLKSIDNCSYSGNLAPENEEAQNVYNESGEKGPSTFDVPHRVVGSYIYELPFGAGKHFLNQRGPVGYVVAGWKISGITQWQSGNPWSIFSPGSPANVGTPNIRANPVGNPFPAGFVRGGNLRMAFNTAAFASAAAGAFGNTGRNIMWDAPLSNTDLSLERDFRFAERTQLQFRAESFNAWNHTQFEQFGNVVGTPTFGIWNTARTARTMQFGLKLTY